MGFGNKLKELLKERGITIKELAKISGISVNTLYSITKRDTQTPTGDIINKIATALGVEPENLLSYEDWKQELDSAFLEMETSEKNLRRKLNEISEMLNGDALVELLNTAIELLQDDDYRSMFYKKN